MAEIPTFIILEGLLHESGAFEVRRAFEDTRAEREIRFDQESGTVTVSLLDKDGEVLRHVSPPVRFPAGCSSGATAATQGCILVAVARHEEARRLELRVDGRVAFSAEVAPRRPEVKVSVQPSKNHTVAVVVDGDGAEVRIVAKLTDGRRISPAVRREGATHAVDLTSLEGLGEAEILVEATSGCRTSQVVATRVTLPEATVRGFVIEPRRDVPWPWGRRGSLIATVSDRNGRKVDWDQSRIVWRVDGKPLKERTQIVAWQPEQAGAHQLELVRDLGDGQVEVLDERTVTVSEQTAEQKEWVRAVAALAVGGARAI